jgi:hypothetical protein
MKNFAAGLCLNQYLRIWSEKLMRPGQAERRQDSTAALAQKASVTSAPASRAEPWSEGRPACNRLWFDGRRGCSLLCCYRWQSLTESRCEGFTFSFRTSSAFDTDDDGLSVILAVLSSL